MSKNGGGALGAPFTAGLRLGLFLSFYLLFDDGFDDGAVEFLKRDVFVGGRVVLGPACFGNSFSIWLRSSISTGSTAGTLRCQSGAQPDEYPLVVNERRGALLALALLLGCDWVCS